MRVLITEPTYKHAIALSRYLKAYDPSLEIVAISSYAPRYPRLFARHYDSFKVGKLEDLARDIPHDLLIPVGNSSVEIASARKLSTAILPPQESVQIGLDKSSTLRIAEQLGIPVPKTHRISSLQEIDSLDLAFPCVVKGAMEAGKNVVSYPSTLNELRRDAANMHGDPSQQGRYPVIQEYIPGIGLGFFGFYQRGVLKRFYMHQRVREFPISGGASTAAKTIYHQKAFDYGKRLLDHLKWHGSAMVEFKYDPATDKLALMEINPKFWGSTELGLAAGVNFGELHVRAARGEEIPIDHSPDSYKKILFCWPFEGDLASLIQSMRWLDIKDYWKKECLTNTRTNGFLLNSFRLADFLRKKR